MRDKVCLVTGSSSGLGKATALSLAQLHATVVLGCRDRQRGEAALAEIKAARAAATADLLLIDLSDLRSVREAVSDFGKRYERLDVLINNAAVFKQRRTLTPDGLETMFATNHVGPFLLTNLLLERLKAAPEARILTITAPSTTELDFDDLQGEKRFNAFQAFGASKACNLLFTYALARRLAGTNVTANAIHPGLMKSQLMREAPLPVRWITSQMSSRPERAAQTVAYYASAPEVQGMNGLFFKASKTIDSSPYTRDQAVQERLWQVSTALTGLA
jgi:NAD(P)-dependent dehydrogenase (short-subunit alcohol dehydrogenase family)